ncbi:hypothetical protein KGZ78_00495 [Pseudomonas aeruginosa]|nr:hypothetical protein KGZ78_00495 [Pseudomonas aeruginosa]
MLPRASIKEFLYEEGQRASAEPERIIGVDDPVVYHLALALLPSFARAGSATSCSSNRSCWRC